MQGEAKAKRKLHSSGVVLEQCRIELKRTGERGKERVPLLPPVRAFLCLPMGKARWRVSVLLVAAGEEDTKEVR